MFSGEELSGDYCLSPHIIHNFIALWVIRRRRQGFLPRGAATAQVQKSVQGVSACTLSGLLFIGGCPPSY
jgi:hypothetical protein